ncbi:hypothetical protein MFABIIPG_00775 [Acinetobacter baumannii]|nr:hypothetical protein MFABIIPG_00775 [Acinetobacter baumannii]
MPAWIAIRISLPVTGIAAVITIRLQGSDQVPHLVTVSVVTTAVSDLHCHYCCRHGNAVCGPSAATGSVLSFAKRPGAVAIVHCRIVSAIYIHHYSGCRIVHFKCWCAVIGQHCHPAQPQVGCDVCSARLCLWQ